MPEERARDEHGNILPWGYRYSEYVISRTGLTLELMLTHLKTLHSASRNPRQMQEESGAFGRHRTLGRTGSRSSRTRTGTTPLRQKENPTVAEFGRLFAREQVREEEEERSRSTTPSATSISANEALRLAEPEAVPTECLLHGYASRATQWKALSKFERIVAPSIICEDYPREDPTLFLSSSSSFMHSRSTVVVRKNLSKDALQKSRVYRGGEHWVKVTFDSYQAAQRACFYSPVEIDGHMVFCEMWQGRGPFSDAPILQGSRSATELQKNAPSKMRTLTTSHPTNRPSAKESAISGFERAIQSLPRSITLPDVQYAQPSSQDNVSTSSTTASSATATEVGAQDGSALRSRSTPAPPTEITKPAASEYMTHIPTVKRAVLRPITEALPPQPTVTERLLRSIPIVSLFVAGKGTGGDLLIGEGPALKEDGSWDESNGWYWGFWHMIDGWMGTDFCGLKED